MQTKTKKYHKGQHPHSRKKEGNEGNNSNHVLREFQDHKQVERSWGKSTSAPPKRRRVLHITEQQSNLHM